MTRARRVPDIPSGGHDLTAAVLTRALSVESWERHWGGTAEGRAAWAALKDRMPPINLTVRRAPWWAYTPGVPEDLRGVGTIADASDDGLYLARCRWLLGDGAAHQRAGEAKALHRMIDRLENPRRYSVTS